MQEQTCLPFPHVRCRYLHSSRIPEIRLSLLHPGLLQLGVPQQGTDAIPDAAWEVVLAIGMARARSSSRLLPPLLLFAGLCCLLFVSGLGVLGWREHIEPLVLWAGMLGGAVFASMLLVLAHLAGCREVFLADRRACSWLGAARLCEGLEQLMQMSPAPRKGRWGMPSLLTRGKRLCGIRLPHRQQGDISEVERSLAKD